MNRVRPQRVEGNERYYDDTCARRCQPRIATALDISAAGGGGSWTAHRVWRSHDSWSSGGCLPSKNTIRWSEACPPPESRCVPPTYPIQCDVSAVNPTVRGRPRHLRYAGQQKRVGFASVFHPRLKRRWRRDLAPRQRRLRNPRARSDSAKPWCAP